MTNNRRRPETFFSRTSSSMFRPVRSGFQRSGFSTSPVSLHFHFGSRSHCNEYVRRTNLNATNATTLKRVRQTISWMQPHQKPWDLGFFFTYQQPPHTRNLDTIPLSPRAPDELEREHSSDAAKSVDASKSTNEQGPLPRKTTEDKLPVPPRNYLCTERGSDGGGGPRLAAERKMWPWK